METISMTKNEGMFMLRFLSSHTVQVDNVGKYVLSLKYLEQK
jgi:hypothetical protein